MRQKIGIERCKCSYKNCPDRWLTGIGKFVQGSGFTQEEAELIVAALDSDTGELARVVIEAAMLIKHMMPGVKHITLPDYQLLNEWPAKAQKALEGTCKTPEQRALGILTRAWKDRALGDGSQKAGILLALELMVREQQRDGQD